MRLFRTSAVLASLSGLALVASLLAPATAASAATGPRTPGAKLDRQVFALGAAQRIDPMPVGAAYETFERVRIVRDLYDDHDWVTVTPTLVAAPQTSAQRVWVIVGLGHRDGNTCRLDVQGARRTEVGARTQEYLYYLGDSDYNARIGPRPDKPYTCGAAWIEPDDSEADLDLLIGEPRNVYVAPKLKVGQVSLLGSTQKKLKLVKGAWTPYSVTVRNTGTGPVQKVTVTRQGKGLKVKKATRTVELAPGKSTTVSLRVRHTGKQKKARLKIKVASPGGVKATRKVQVVRTKAPKRPVAGRYAGGGANFRIKGGRVRGFTVTTTQRCEAAGDVQRTYSFPTVKIPKHGIVVASRSGKASGSRWTSSLQLKVVGKKVTKARFGFGSYAPGVPGSSCSAGQGFTVKRVG